MRRRKLRLLVMGAVLSIAAPIGAVGLGASQASAGITTGLPAPYVTTANSSDPDAEPCVYNGLSGYCLYTSRDNPLGLDTYGNYYPMTETLGYFSQDGLSWTPEGNRNHDVGGIFNEGQYHGKGWVPSNAHHLWAPDMAHVGNTYFLLVPDVSDLNNESTSSFIGVSTSSNPFGPFTPKAQIHGVSSVNGGYASDPDVVLGGDGREYLVYANGDASNCGGLSIGWVNNSLSGFHTGWPKQISIADNNLVPGPKLTDLGGCVDSNGTHHSQPYMEGPSIYYTPSWGLPGTPGYSGVPGPYLLEFAAKPDHVPAGCDGGGEPNTANEVIAYATADSAAGPYTYQGILMCGSSQEWTDQASILPMKTGDAQGDTALVLVYHDSSTPGGPPQNRTLHAQCLLWGGGKFAGAIRTDGSLNSGISDCTANFNPYTAALRSRVNGKLVSAQFGSGYPTGELLATSQFAGPWESFEFTQNGYTPIAIRVAQNSPGTISAGAWKSDQNGEFVTSSSSNSPLQANSSFVGTTQNFNIGFDLDGTIQFAAYGTGVGVTTQSDATLKANASFPTFPEDYDLLHY